MVAAGGFREDLFYRLNVLQIRLPPLRDRAEDVPLLARHFVNRFRLETGRPISGITDDALSCLARYAFPGNVRELENIIERAFIVCQGSQIHLADLPAHVREPAGPVSPGSVTGGELRDVEARAVLDALRRHSGNRTKAAADLGIHRSTLHRKVRRLKLA
jgi:transcriptional regulator with PAS, ATPase and Fis domain